MRLLVVVNQPSDWNVRLDDVEVVDARAYLTEPRYNDIANVRVFNLCRSYGYQTVGYYVSLLAAARGHKPIPSVTTIQDLKSQTMARVVSDDLDDRLQEDLTSVGRRRFELDIVFGGTVDPRFERLGRTLFNVFQAPFLRAAFQHDKEEGWQLHRLRALSISELEPGCRALIRARAADFFSRGRFHVPRRRPPRYSLAILHDPQETNAPSDAKALERFEEAAESLGIETDLITHDDFARLAEYDALFIRETTAVTHHTYRFARRAEAEGLIVMDDSLSILRCANKVYLAELLARHGIRTPRTIIVHRDNTDQVIPALGLPVVLKQPDSSFSMGVTKADNAAAYEREVDRLLDKSDLVIAQEFIQTPFDWRIGIVDRRPLYACKYYMARRHWQIIHRQGDNQIEGRSETLPVELAPRAVVSTALRAANLIGDGLYGVDLKQVGRSVYVIEVNDNPSLEAGIEDEVLKEDLYRRIMDVFLRRLDRQHAPWPM